MVTLTVGYVSGIIAAAVFVVQKYVPTAMTLVLIGLLKDDNSAVTWSVAGRAIQSSYWPTILGTDASASRGVRRSVKLVSWFRPLVLSVVAVTAIVTPLGLFDVILADHNPTDSYFHYVQDTSPMGYGTPPRPTLGFSRKCGDWTPIACPSSDVVVITTKNATTISADLPNGYDTRIPRNVSDVFQSGLDSFNKSVSSFFDIQYRTYTPQQDNNTDNGDPYLVGSFRYLTSVLLDNAIEPVEGLIVDAQNGGIGFRNHTIPGGVPFGAQWNEDLLFVEPETQCIDTNLTLDFSIPSGTYTGSVNDLVLTDRGGFANIVKKWPEDNLTDPQKDADLLNRAYKAAWANNAYTMLYYNVTTTSHATTGTKAFSYLNSSVGQTFPLPTSLSTVSYDELQTSSNFGSYLNLMDNFGDSGLGGYSTLGNSTLNMNLTTPSNFSYNTHGTFTVANPFGISRTNFTTINTLCQGANGKDYANISNIAVSCGLVNGAARRADGSKSLIFEPDSKWTIPLYTCATATKASIKTVTLKLNGTEGLRSLVVTNLQDKVYPDDQSTPLWGVEYTQDLLSDVLPIWGLVSPQYQGKPGISTVRSERLYLPGLPTTIGSPPTVNFQNLPGVEFHTDALGSAYSISSGSSGASGLPDYSGKTSLAIYSKWQDLSRTAATTAQIINLVWTDVAANSVTGTRSWLGSLPLLGVGPDAKSTRDSAVPTSGQAAAQVPIIIYAKHIRYHMLFAIPAFITLALVVLITLATVFFAVVRGSGRPSVIKRYLYQVSTGRLLAVLTYPDAADPLAPTHQWIDQVGTKKVTLAAGGAGGKPGGEGPLASPSDFHQRTSERGAGNGMTDPLLAQKEGSSFIAMRPMAGSPSPNSLAVAGEQTGYFGPRGRQEEVHAR